MSVFREWLGSAIVAVVGVVVGTAALWNEWPGWALGVVIVATVVGVLLWAPLFRGEAPPVSGSAFIKGPVVGSYLSGIDSDAETFIDGSVHESLITRITHRARGNSRATWR